MCTMKNISKINATRSKYIRLQDKGIEKVQN